MSLSLVEARLPKTAVSMSRQTRVVGPRHDVQAAADPGARAESHGPVGGHVGAVKLDGAPAHEGAAAPAVAVGAVWPGRPERAARAAGPADPAGGLVVGDEAFREFGGSA